MNRTEEKACQDSPNGEHVWEKTAPEKTADGREDWSVIPGEYCAHCEKPKD